MEVEYNYYNNCDLTQENVHYASSIKLLKINDNKRIVNTFKSGKTLPRNVLMVTEPQQTAWQSVRTVSENF